MCVYYTSSKVLTGILTPLTAVDIYNRPFFRPEVRKVFDSGGTKFLYPPQAALFFLFFSHFKFKILVHYWL
ncbi:MAG: hypothetical protein V1898_01570 [Patescibacteria group bacterium]